MTLQRIPPLSRFEESPLRRALVEALREVPIGETVKYEALTRVVGEDIHSAWHFVTSARGVLLKEGIVFDVVRKVGLKRMDDEGKVAVSEGHLDKAKHSARRSLRHLRTADFATLSDDAKRRHCLAEIRGGMVLQFAGRKVERRLSAAIERGADTASIRHAVAGTLKQFKVG